MKNGKRDVSTAERSGEGASEMIDLRGDGAGTGIAQGTRTTGEQQATSGLADCLAEISQPEETHCARDFGMADVNDGLSASAVC